MTTLRLLSSMAPKDCLAAAIELYEQSHPDQIEAHAAGGVDVLGRIAAGEVADIVVLADDAIDKLQQEGHVRPASRRPLLSSGIAVASRPSAPYSDISNEPALRTAVLDAPSLSYSTGPSGRYLESLFTRWKILDTIRTRIIVPPPGTPVASLVADGTATLGFQQLSEMLRVPGIRVLGALPPEIQRETVFTGAITSVSAQQESAREFLIFLASPALAPIWLKFGMSGVKCE